MNEDRRDEEEEEEVDVSPLESGVELQMVLS
jgi:hypothetical protein